MVSSVAGAYGDTAMTVDQIPAVRSAPWTARTVAARSVLVGFAATAGVLGLFAQFNAYGLAHWSFTYGHGMVSRSLVGTVFQGLGGNPQQDVAATVYVLYFVTAGALMAAAWWLTRGRPDLGGAVAVVLLFAATLPHLASQLALFDGLILILTVLAATASHYRAGLSLAGVILAVAVLVHEAAVLLTVPWITAYAADASPNLRSWLRRALTVAALPLLAALAVAVRTPSLAPDELAEVLFREDYPDRLAQSAIDTEYMTLTDHIDLTAAVVAQRPVLIYYLWVGAVPLLLVVTIAALALRRAGIGRSDLTTSEKVLVASSMAPLLALPVAHDWHRWMMFAGVGIGMSALVILRRRPTVPAVPSVWVTAGVMVAVGWALLLPLR